MKAALYLERAADDHMVAEVVFALTGVRIKADTQEKAALIFSALCKARQPGKEYRMQPLKDLRREGLDAMPERPEPGKTTAQTIEAFTKKYYPDVIAFEEYMNLGIGTFEMEDNNERGGLTRDRATINALLLRTGMDRKLSSSFVATIPALRWQRVTDAL